MQLQAPPILTVVIWHTGLHICLHLTLLHKVAWHTFGLHREPQSLSATIGLTRNKKARGQRTQVDSRVRPNYPQALVGVARQREVQVPVGNKCCRVCAVQRRVDSQCRKSMLAADNMCLFTYTGCY